MIVDERMLDYILSLDKDASPIVRTIEQEAIRDYVPIIRKESQSLLRVLLKIKKPGQVLEVGTAIGFSAILMGECLPENSHLTTIEKYEKRIPIARENFKRAGMEDKITLLEGDAVEVLKGLKGPYDFIFMDHMMPEMDGVETLHRIRDKVGAYYHKVPVIALTANATAGARERFIEDGFTDFLEKPVEVSVLERVMRRNLPIDKILSLNSETKNAAEEKKADVKEETLLQEMSVQEKQIEQVQEVLDVEKGFLYCGGEAGYRKVLTCYNKSGHENKARIEELFQKEDWYNYTIAVHGIKSAMLSIGAMHVSELAKKLETAGKRENIEYIRMNHADMMTEYERILEYLKECPYVEREEQDGEDATELPTLSAEMFRESVDKMEQAMFELDGEKMLSILTELECYQYGAVALKEALVPVRRKIEMSDYMSAAEYLMKLQERLSDNAKGGDVQ